MSIPFLLVGGTGIVVLSAIGLARRRYAQRRQAFRKLLERYGQSGLALVRYVMLNRQCSEEGAYQRIASFVTSRSPELEHSVIDRLLSNDRQNLLQKAGSILIQYPYEIDKI